MSLYTPRYFAARHDEDALKLVREYPFATLITSVDGAEPHITHLPILLEEGALAGHMARANPHWKAFAAGRTVAVFHGPHAYISPRGYVEPAAHVPTWNYAVVHVHGRPQMLDDAVVPGHIVHLTGHFERGAWTPAPENVQRLAPGVVGFRMVIERIDAKVKMSQNRSADDRASLVRALRAEGGADQQAVADWIARNDD